jgi:hypothetical protein
MANRDIMTFENSKQYVIELLFDTPLDKTTDYGEKKVYAFTCNGVEYVTFQAEGGTIDTTLGSGKKGDIFTIEKVRNDKGNWIFAVTKGDTTSTVKPSDQLKPDDPPPRTSPPPVDWDLKEAKKEHEIRKAVCIKLAVDKIPEGAWKKATETEIKGKFMTLMLIMSDDLELVLARIKLASNVFHLNAMWKKYSHLWGNLLSAEDFGTAIDACAKKKASFDEPADPVLVPDEGESAPFISDDEPLPF